MGGHAGLIPRLDFGQNGGHLQCCCAEVGGQDLVAASSLFQQGIALLDDVAITFLFAVGMGLADQLDLLTMVSGEGKLQRPPGRRPTTFSRHH